MNDLEFRQRALAEPRDRSPEFLAAARESAERQRFLEELLSFEDGLADGLRIPAPERLRERLRDPEALEAERGAAAPMTGDAPPRRALWTRLLPVAASLLIAVVLGFTYWAERANAQFEEDIFAHVYREISYLEMDNDVDLPLINRYLAAIGGRLEESGETEALEIHVADDCWVINRDDSVHLVLAGERGPVTVLMVSNSPVRREFEIEDERFAGLVTPTPRGNLVVLGEKSEALTRYQRLFANNLSWEY